MQQQVAMQGSGLRPVPLKWRGAEQALKKLAPIFQLGAMAQNVMDIFFS